MSKGWVRWRRLFNSIRQCSSDLLTVLGLTIVTPIFISHLGIHGSPFRVLFGLPFVLFLPGYALIAALFPEESVSLVDIKNRDTEARIVKDAGSTNISQEKKGINRIERVALSFGLSIIIVALTGLVLNYTVWGLRFLPVILSISSFTIICTILAVIRRQRLPEKDRFSVSYSGLFALLRTKLFNPTNRVDAVLTLILVLGVVFAVSSVGYAIMTAGNSSQFSEFYLLTEDEDGDLTADGYPSEFTRSEGQTLVVGITNHERETINYTVVVQVQQVEIEADEIVTLEQEELDRFQTRLADSDTWHHSHEITPSISGENLRLTYLLYKQEPPEEPTQENSYQNLHLWIDVADDSEIEIQEPADSDTNRDNETEAETEEENDSGIEIQEPIDD